MVPLRWLPWPRMSTVLVIHSIDDLLGHSRETHGASLHLDAHPKVIEVAVMVLANWVF